ncbi:hypothetical protein MAR_008388 [Mya arenaria]|uniref:tRNA/rRNA methyltransferase SpoU type domain-containing protein n=1 Tax=Mya arenaria TaxID=6604 RepID=A0ABY7DWJ7_MYAAR|nr:hypothetical protein MAR_008388 [Mya arenaria]
MAADFCPLDVHGGRAKMRQERQRQFAKEIEKAKIEMENIRLVEQVWFDDYVNGKYVNDLTLNRPFANNDITPSDGDSIDEEVESKEVNENKNDLALMEAGTVSDAESRTNGYRVTNEVSHAADGSTCAEAESVHYFIQHKDVIYKLQQHKETMEGQSACLPNILVTRTQQISSKGIDKHRGKGQRIPLPEVHGEVLWGIHPVSAALQAGKRQIHQALFQKWRDAGGVIVGSTSNKEHSCMVPLHQFTADKPILLLIGNEATGLPDAICQHCDVLLYIGGHTFTSADHWHVSSLNVSVATGILLHSIMQTRLKTNR